MYSKITSIGGYNSVFLVFAGWLADVYFGRYKVMKVSIWVMWWGVLVGECWWSGYY